MSLDSATELKIQQKIRQAEDDLVIWIQAALDSDKSYGDLKEAQFRNLVRVASSTESTEVIKNFLLYQASKKEDGRDYKWGWGENSLAQNIIKDINTVIHNRAQDIAKETSPNHSNQIWLELIRRYLGYGSRYLKYINSIKNERDDKGQGTKRITEKPKK
ncbi:MAG TPA: hypothetical protein IGS52_15085 [Oscillatoriaceae cyanobacterium M33_DOE_052]|uniref:CRISPR type III-B/RAMP module-associated protein Cmr5 n=1 Tax=Planktothricoides sp. SpSt-374 TaxID=2282167 RepID=A0A7C3ZZ88_9CYAN|nr:hypothetical protein [Oscillatoriaceae cyanobacterium M33_DOE_052]